LLAGNGDRGANRAAAGGPDEKGEKLRVGHTGRRYGRMTVKWPRASCWLEAADGRSLDRSRKRQEPKMDQVVKGAVIHSNLFAWRDVGPTTIAGRAALWRAG